MFVSVYVCEYVQTSGMLVLVCVRVCIHVCMYVPVPNAYVRMCAFTRGVHMYRCNHTQECMQKQYIHLKRGSNRF